jgi:hypothetical protein
MEIARPQESRKDSTMSISEKIHNAWAGLREWWSGVTRPLRPADVPVEVSDGLPDDGLAPLDPVPPRDIGPAAPHNHAPRAQGLNLCIDLGTFASTVARERDGVVDLAVLSYDRAPAGGGWAPAYEISSKVLWLDDEPFTDPVRFEEMMQVHSDAEITRSFKRLLFEYVWFEHNPRNIRRLTAIYEELLLLALDPEKSSTFRHLQAGLSAEGVDVKGAGSEAERLRLWKTLGGLPNLERERRLQESIVAGARLRLCVPNAFDSQSILIATGRLNEAFARVVEKIFPHIGQGQYPEPIISIIREAEAITWCIENVDANAKPALVLDIGAGTTDAALVRLTASGAEAAYSVLFRTGVPFGGDDVDLIFLSAAYARGRNTPALMRMDLKQKLHVTQEVRKKKEEWSALKETLTPEEDEFLRRALAQPAGEPLPEFNGEHGVLVPVQDGERDEPLETAHPFAIPAFVDFLRLTVIATCEPLLKQAKGELSLILLSGAASYTPGVATALQTLIEKYNCPVKITRVSELLNLKLPMISPVRRAKLACVYGGTNSLPFNLDVDPDFLPEAIRLEIRTAGVTKDHDLFAAGERLRDGSSLAYFSTTKQVEHVCTIHRYFTPQEYIDRKYRTSSWVRRFMGRARLEPTTTALAFRLSQNHESASNIQAWTANTRHRNQLLPYALEAPAPPQRGAEISPLTGLPLEWLWEENDA